MASGGIIGRLKVVLGLDNSSYKTTLKQTEDASERATTKIQQDWEKTSSVIEKHTMVYNPLLMTYEKVKTATRGSGLDAIPKQAAAAAKGFNGLNVQMQMVARELPVLALSPQMFFLAVSNNLPMLADEIAKVNAQNKILAAEGKKGTSVFKQVAKSLFGWQTALVLGVTLLTAYGGKLVSWVGSLFDSERALSAAEQAQRRLNDAMEAGARNAADEMVRLDLLAKTASNTNLSMQTRLKAVQDLKKEFPAYFKDLSNEAVLQGNVAAAYEKTARGILAAAQARAIEEEMVKNVQRERSITSRIDIAGLQSLQEGTKQLDRITAADVERDADIIDRSYAYAQKRSEAFEALAEYLKTNDESLYNELDAAGAFEEQRLIVLQDFIKGLQETNSTMGEEVMKLLDASSEFTTGQEAAGAGGGKSGAAKAVEDTLAAQKAAALEAKAALEAQAPLFGQTIAYNEELLRIQQQLFALSTDPAERIKLAKENELLKEKIALLSTPLTTLVATGFDVDSIELPDIDTDSALLKRLEAEKKAVEQFVGDMNSILEKGIENAISGFAQALGQLAAGDYSSAWQSLLIPVADMVVQFGELLIAYGVSMVAFKNAFTNPWAAIGAGGVLVILGSAISSAISQNSGGTTSAGTVSGNTFTGGYSSAGAVQSAVSVGGYQAAPIEVEVAGVLSGQDILISSERAKQLRGR